MNGIVCFRESRLVSIEYENLEVVYGDTVYTIFFSCHSFINVIRYLVSSDTQLGRVVHLGRMCWKVLIYTAMPNRRPD
jgi:hypothetical protein